MGPLSMAVPHGRASGRRRAAGHAADRATMIPTRRTVTERRGNRMFGSQALETAIGLALLFFVLASALQVVIFSCWAVALKAGAVIRMHTPRRTDI